MIESKLIPSFYMAHIEGKAVERLFVGDFGIAGIELCSNDFENDFSATGALHTVMKYLTATQENRVENVDFNPEFFPSLEPVKLSEEHTSLLEEAEEAAKAYETKEPGNLQVIMTRAFDSFGDFVESRWTSKSENSNVLGRIALNPDEYMKAKAYDKICQAIAFVPTETRPQTTFH